MTLQSPPDRRQIRYVRLLLLPAMLMAAATGAAVALVAQPARLAVGLCGGVATVLVLIAAAEAVRRGRGLRDARAEYNRHRAYLEQRIGANEAENARLANEVVPTAVAWLRAGFSPREVMTNLKRDDPAFGEMSEAHQQVVQTVLGIVDHEGALRDSAQRSFVSVARRVQAIVHQQSNELREMEEDHGRNPEVFDDLLRIDHGTALIGRLADSIAVLGGGRPGRQWPLPVPLYSVLRGAMSRILEYRRIKLDNIAKLNIRGISVEPLIHALAELLDNATRYSPPQTLVHVNAVEVQTGVAVEIEDAGVSLNEESRARVEGMIERAMAGEVIQEVGDVPRLGLAVVGRLCTSFNLKVSLRASAYGGVRAVLVIPKEMITDEQAPGYAHGIGATATPRAELGAVEGPKRPPKKRRPTNPKIPAGVSLEDDVPVVTEWTDKGLPQRRSRATVSIVDQYREAYAAKYAAERAAKEGKPEIWARPEPEPEAEPVEAPGAWIADFWDGLKKDNPGVHPTDFTRNPTAYMHLIEKPADSEADNEGDLK